MKINIIFIWIICTIFLLILPTVRVQHSVPNDLYVGAIFSSNQKQQEIAFKNGIEEANRILENQKKPYIKHRLIAQPMTTDNFNSFLASQQTCDLLTKKVITILGPTDPLVSDEVQAICTKFGIPFLDMNPIKLQRYKPLTINMYPHYSNITNCLKDYINSMAWKDLVIIYSENRDLVKFAELLNKFDKRVLLKKIVFDGTEKYLLKELKSNNFNHFIVDIPYWYFSRFMKMTETYNMTNQFYSFLFTNWDTQLLDLKNQPFNTAANISTLTLFPFNEQKSKDKRILNFQKDIYELEKLKHNAQIFTFLTTETAMIYKSMRMLAYSVIEVLQLSQISLSTRLSCKENYGWAQGAGLFNGFSSAKVNIPKGFEDEFTMNANGWMDNYRISISRLQNKFYFEDFGYWTPRSGLKITRRGKTKEEVSLEISKQTLRVITIIDSPYVISKKVDANGVTPKDPSAWSGFCMELLKKISEDLKFNYTIEEVHDKSYGGFKNVDGVEVWNGLVGDLISHKADIAVSSLTITYDRERVIDFTTPYMNLGISIIFQRPHQEDVKLWAFLKPLSTPVWGYVIMSYISVSFVLFVIGRFSPYEWYNQSPCQTDNQFHSNQFNILNSMWFTIGSFMQQGTDIIPKATSTRIVAGMWWFFTLIIISSYTANLAAFLTLARMKVPIENAEDLSKQVGIKYGTVKGGSTYTFFEKSKLPTYKKMHKFMFNNPLLMVKNNGEGIKKVRETSYAFILESTTNEFYTRRQCDLVRIGGLLDSKGYGIGLPQGSIYRDVITESILKLEKAQEIEKLKRYFWRDYNNTSNCPPPEDSSPTSSLGIKETGGVFVMLFTGALVSILMAVFEMIFKAWKRSISQKTPLCAEVNKITSDNLKRLCNKSSDDEEGESNEVDVDGYLSSSSDINQFRRRHRKGSQSPSPKNFTANNIIAPSTVPSQYHLQHSFSQSTAASFDNTIPNAILPPVSNLRPGSPIYHLASANSITNPSAIPAPIIQPNFTDHTNLSASSGYRMMFKDSHYPLQSQQQHQLPLSIDDNPPIIQPQDHQHQHQYQHHPPPQQPQNESSFDNLSNTTQQQVRMKKVAC